jgi:hypothetical protein
VIDIETKEQLERELLKMDIELRRKQLFWETPRNLAIVVGAAVALSAALAGWLGYQTGRNPPSPPAPIIIQVPK